MNTRLRLSLLALIVLLLGISTARMFITTHRQEERLSILEHQVEQLLADTTRLQIAPAPGGQLAQRNRGYYSNYERPYYEHRSYDRSYDRRHDAQSRAARQPVSAADTVLSAAPDGAIAADVTAATATMTSHKFSEPHTFDLNTIDSLTLIRIPGIAGRTASVILRQRQRYGGFYSAEQLRDFLTWDAALDYLDEWCQQWFTADASRLRSISVNTATISDLQRHPYITHEQAVELVRYRTRHKRIASAAELQQCTTFTPQQLQQLLPYLSFL